MKEFLITGLFGTIIGFLDILPMMKMKLDRYSIASAFVFYFVLPFVIWNVDLFGMAWWLKGGILGLALALPTIIVVAKEDKKSVPPMLLMSVVLGTLTGVTGHYML